MSYQSSAPKGLPFSVQEMQCCAVLHEMVSEQNTRTILLNPSSPNPNHMLKKQALSSIPENTTAFHPALPFLSLGITKSHRYSVWALQSSRYLQALRWLGWHQKGVFRQIHWAVTQRLLSLSPLLKANRDPASKTLPRKSTETQEKRDLSFSFGLVF